MSKSYNPCDDCKYGIERRDGSGDDSMCRICEFKAMGEEVQKGLKIQAYILELIPIYKERLANIDLNNENEWDYNRGHEIGKHEVYDIAIMDLQLIINRISD